MAGMMMDLQLAQGKQHQADGVEWNRGEKDVRLVIRLVHEEIRVVQERDPGFSPVKGNVDVCLDGPLAIGKPKTRHLPPH